MRILTEAQETLLRDALRDAALYSLREASDPGCTAPNMIALCAKARDYTQLSELLSTAHAIAISEKEAA